MEYHKNLMKISLAENLRSLMLRHMFEKITIKQICDATGVIRATFYNYFSDKYDCLNWIVYHDIVENTKDYVESGDFEKALTAALEVLIQNKQFYRIAYHVTGQNSFEDMIAYVDENGMITSTPPAENTPKEEIKLEEIVISTPKKDKEEPVIRRGRIEFFNESKGFGFIKDLSGVEKYFFHINNVLTDIAENNIVTFDLERGLKGMNAVNVALEVEKAKEKKENKETLNTES